MPTENRIRFASSPGSIVRCYAVSKPMAGVMETVVAHAKMDRNQLQELVFQSRITAESAEAIGKLLALPDLTHIVLRQHDLIIMLKADTWDTVHDRALQIIGEVYFPKEDVEIQDYSACFQCKCRGKCESK